MKYWGSLGLILAFILTASYQGVAKEIALIDCPTADVLTKRSYRIVSRVFPEDGLLLKGQLGLFERFTIGISYGGIKVISADNPEWYPSLEFMVRYRLMDEDISFPALAIGFDSQGYGSFSGLHRRYDTKAKGIYGVASKGFAPLMGLRVHVGLNYNSFEGDNGERENDSDDDEDENDKKSSKFRNGNMEDDENDDMASLNGFIGLDFPFNPQMVGILEYDFANNDNRRDNLYGNGEGYLNAAFRWRINNNFQCELGFKDLLGSAGTFSRYLSLNYENTF